MPPPYTRHLFVCTNRRPDGSPKGCCATRGSEELRLSFKKELDAQGVQGVRANAAGCLDACEVGPAVAVYPDNVWYQQVSQADVKQIISEHIVGGRPVERLLMKFPIPRAKKE